MQIIYKTQNKMRRNFVLLFIAVLSHIKAQKLQFEWGESFEGVTIRGYSMLRLPCATDSICFFTQLKTIYAPSAFYMTKKTFGGLGSNNGRVIKMPEVKGQGTDLYYIKAIDNRPVLLSYRNDRKFHLLRSYLHVLKNDSTVDENYRILGEIRDFRHTDDFIHLSSPDTRKFMTAYFEKRKKDQKIRVKCHVIDKNINVVWSELLELPYIGRQCKVSEMQIINTGDFYFMVELKFIEEGKKLKKPVYKLFFYKWKEKVLSEVSINSEDNYLFDLRYETDQDSNIVCGGLFCEKKQKIKTGTKRMEHWVKGAFYIKVDPKKKEVIEHNKYALPESPFLRGEYPAYYLDHMYLMDEGRVIFLSERRFVDQAQTKGAPAIQMNEEIMIINIAQNSASSWSKFIPKHQARIVGPGIDYSSYFVLSNKDELNILYNDTKHSLLKVVSAKGGITDNPVFQNSEQYVIPKLRVQMSDNEVIFYSQHKPDTFRFGKVRLIN
ncbi:hypothetical protein CNR22_24300 [Sphingobacteriaceae bacterium]|nr:hypothetical protein CNR22_00060 [Sphingobacteriaceae bacterium]PBQ34763.1 hypothetical protein CNR22_24300 [Sphingobacteriaceae bacterium]